MATFRLAMDVLSRKNPLFSLNTWSYLSLLESHHFPPPPPPLPQQLIHGV
jgi:hypothetical protein